MRPHFWGVLKATVSPCGSFSSTFLSFLGDFWSNLLFLRSLFPRRESSIDRWLWEEILCFLTSVWQCCFISFTGKCYCSMNVRTSHLCWSSSTLLTFQSNPIGFGVLRSVHRRSSSSLSEYSKFFWLGISLVKWCWFFPAESYHCCNVETSSAVAFQRPPRRSPGGPTPTGP